MNWQDIPTTKLIDNIEFTTIIDLFSTQVISILNQAGQESQE
ncbi:MAG: hypothetical protein QM487_06280 [Candidatus Marithrix sp.]